jgi:hypothetical protein
MEKLSRSVRQGKQEKFDADWVGRTDDVATVQMTWHDGTPMAADVATLLTWQVFLVDYGRVMHFWSEL